MRMNLRFSPCTKAIALVVALGFAANSLAAENPLRWKFTDGEKLNYVLDRGIEGKLNLSGAEIEFKMGMVFDVTWNVKSVSKEGVANIQQTVDRVQISMESPLGGNLDYDSKEPDKKIDSPIWAQMEPMIVGMLGESFAMKISPLGKVSDIELPKKLAEIFAKQQQGGNRQAGFGLGTNGFSERGVKELIEKSVLPLPEQPIGSSVNWKQHFENPIPRIGTQTAETTYSFGEVASVDGKPLQKVISKTELTFEPEENAQADLEITSQEASATFYFDAQAGRMVKSDGTQISAMELSGPRELTQEIKESFSMRTGTSADKK